MVDAERRDHPGLHQLAARIAGRRLAALRAQPADLPDTFWDKEARPRSSTDDEIVKGVTLTRGGAVVHPAFARRTAAA